MSNLGDVLGTRPDRAARALGEDMVVVELDACKVENRDYSTEEYRKLTDLQRQKLYLLRNPGTVLGTGPTRQSRRGGRGRTDTASVASTNTSGTKRSEDDSHNEFEGGDDPSSPGSGRLFFILCETKR